MIHSGNGFEDALKVENEQLQKEMIAVGQVGFVSDHHGVVTEMEINGLHIDCSEEKASL